MKVRACTFPSRLRLGMALIVMLIVISSPVVMLINPSLVTATSSTREGGAFSAPSTISQEGDFTAQADLQIPRTLQSNDLVNSLAFYEVTFITSTTGAIDKIRMDFPEGTNIGAAGVIERVGIGGGMLLKSGSSITYDVTTPVSIPAGTFIRLEMFGIKNPPFSPLVPFFTATITTRDSGGNLIDGPSSTNIYKIKQIGTNDLADDAVTTSKIADDAIQPQVIERVGNSVSAPPGGRGGGTAFCLSGEIGISGGAFVPTGGEPHLTIMNEGASGNGWFIEMFNADPTFHRPFTPKVTCMPFIP